MKVAAPLLLAIVVLLAAAGCSKEQLNSSVYESMRYMSNQENAGNSQYEPDDIDEYEVYKSRRDGYLEDRQAEPPAEQGGDSRAE